MFSKSLRFGLSLWFGFWCECPQCQVTSNVGWAMRATKANTPPVATWGVTSPTMSMQLWTLNTLVRLVRRRGSKPPYRKQLWGRIFPLRENWAKYPSKEKSRDDSPLRIAFPFTRHALFSHEEVCDKGSGKSKWGLSKWGLKVLVHHCPRLPTIVVVLRRKFPLERGPKRPQKCTIVDDCAQIAESGLKPPFESPHLDFPERRLYGSRVAIVPAPYRTRNLEFQKVHFKVRKMP